MPRITKIQLTEQHKLDALKMLQNEVKYSALLGDYKGYKKSINDYSKLAAKNKYLLYDLPKTEINVPLFSKAGLNMLKIAFLNLFRKKSPEEKELISYAKRVHIENKYS